MGSGEKGTKVPADTKYTEDHEWIMIDDDGIGTCGITDHAQHSLGDIVFVEFINNILNAKIDSKETVAIIESPKAASDVYSPVGGTIVDINRELEDSPELINRSPYDEGWIFKIKVKDKSELENLMDPADYLDYIKAGD